MKQITYFIVLIAALSLFGKTANAQCLDFAKTRGFAALDTAAYVPEGRLNAIPLSEGDNLDVYKSFFRGRTYKVVVIGEDNMPTLEFKVSNFQRETLYDSKTEGSTSWVFTSETNQNLIISVEVPKAGSGASPKTGCIAVIVGFEE